MCILFKDVFCINGCSLLFYLSGLCFSLCLGEDNSYHLTESDSVQTVAGGADLFVDHVSSAGTATIKQHNSQ